MKANAIPLSVLLWLIISNVVCFSGLKNISIPLSIGVQIALGVVGFFLYSELAKNPRVKPMKNYLFISLILMVAAQIFLIING